VKDFVRASQQALAHVRLAEAALEGFRNDGVSPLGTLEKPHLQAVTLKAAHAELAKAIAIIERTRWGSAAY